MQASRVHVDPKKLVGGKLSQKQRRQLRYRLIKEYIQERPYGEQITANDIMHVAVFKAQSAAHMFLKEMVERGYLVREEIGPKKFTYIVPGDVRHLDKDGGASVEDESIEVLAREYAWTENSDSLRGFMLWRAKRK